jgi:hypothetical protein
MLAADETEAEQDLRRLREMGFQAYYSEGRPAQRPAPLRSQAA